MSNSVVCIGCGFYEVVLIETLNGESLICCKGCYEKTDKCRCENIESIRNKRQSSTKVN